MSTNKVPFPEELMYLLDRHEMYFDEDGNIKKGVDLLYYTHHVNYARYYLRGFEEALDKENNKEILREITKLHIELDNLLKLISGKK